jgi:hypothetical protein
MCRESGLIAAISAGPTSTTPSPPAARVEWQWTLGEIVTAVVAAGLEILSLGEYPEPFWRASSVSAAAWNGRLPNSFGLLARRTR